MSTDYKFQGWLGKDPSAVEGKMVWEEFEPKKWTEEDVDIEITHCGICGSDLHTLRSGWAPTTYPCCVGHEIVGRAVRVGKHAKKGLQVGDRVGVGAQSDSCGACEECRAGRDNYCTKGTINTYNSEHKDGSTSKGGYADYARVPSRFVFRIPDGLPSEAAAPMLCGGLTLYAPLVNNGCGPGKKVGIIGVGGLGHFGVLFAKALGADKVVGISRSASKRDDALKLGADEYIATEEEKDWAEKHGSTLDLIVSTVSGPKIPLAEYLQLLRPHGTFIQVGAPEDAFPGFNAFSLITKGIKIGGSAIGTPTQLEEMLAFAVDKKIKPWTQQRPLKDANQAVVDMDKGKARYRYVLVNEKHAGQ